MRTYQAVHQYHSGLAQGDAITQQMFTIRRELESLGYRSEIFGAHIDPSIRNRTRPITEYQGSESELLLIHHSIGADIFDDVVDLPNDIVTVYHNITPERFFDDDGARKYVRLGYEQLSVLSRRSRFGIADSNFNRREMLRVGFRRVEVLPVRTDFESFAKLDRSDAQRTSDWLFVGRIVGNKCQHKLVREFADYARRFDDAAQLILVGDTSHVTYVDVVRSEARSLGVEDRVVLTGKVTEDELHKAFRDSGFYVSLSEHEGFGVPILEAMASRVPVIALGSAAVPETMGGAGIVLRELQPGVVAGAVQALRTDDAFRDRLIARQTQRVRQVESFDVSALLERCIRRAAGEAPSLEVQVQGPFETTYSLAGLNRELAISLDRIPGVNASIYATEGPGDYQPSPESLALVPDAAELFRRSVGVPYPHVAIRQMYPPRVLDSPASITCQYFGWEETSLPAAIVNDFNSYLDGIGAMSTFVEQVLRRSGVEVPIKVVGVGVQPPDLAHAKLVPELSDLSGFTFLNIGSAFPRKAVDVLLRAYFAEFSGLEPVTLLLKTFPNPHNETGALLDELRSTHPDPPEVRWIDRDLSTEEIAGLYRSASCYVHPARSEGFGLPVAEAMAVRVPVISVAYSGLADFVSDETAVTIPFQLVPSESHLTVAGSLWAEPDQASLQSAMRGMFVNDGDHVLQERLDRAQALIGERFSWESVTNRWVEFLSTLELLVDRPTVAMVSSWNTPCGIAENTRYIVEGSREFVDIELYADKAAEILDDNQERAVSRVWVGQWDPDLSGLGQAILLSDPDIVHVQFNFGFFELANLAQFLEENSRRRATVISLHRTKEIEIDGRLRSLEEIAEQLRHVDRIIVHQNADAQFLVSLGIRDNVRVVPLGVATPTLFTAGDVRSSLGLPAGPVLATFGFLLPHKGTMELLEGLELLKREIPDITLLALCARHPNPTSQRFEIEVRSEITRRDLNANVILVTDYLSDETAATLLQAADAIVLPYRETEESSSAALRFVLPLGRPIVATDLRIFADAADALLLAKPGDVPDLVSKIRRVLLDDALRDLLIANVTQISRSYRWGHVVQRHREIYAEAVRSRDRQLSVARVGTVRRGRPNGRTAGARSEQSSARA